MRTTIVMNMKGGTAKTMTVINMAAILCQDYSSHVLLVDADSQTNLSEFVADVPEQVGVADSIVDLLNGEKVQGVLYTTIPGAQLLPADMRLMALDIAAMLHGGLQSGALREWLAGMQNYDHCLIDCPPAFSAATLAACAAADDVIIPVKLDDFGVRGVAKIIEQIRNMQRINPKLEIAGVLPTIFYRNETLIEAENQLRSVLNAVGITVFPHIRRSDKVDESTFEQAPLISFSPKSSACRDYRHFVVEYLAQEEG